ncbi:MAG: CDP-alcohol phosphatidyltransferase family protein [Acetivibrio ethanolgignens]
MRLLIHSPITPNMITLINIVAVIPSICLTGVARQFFLLAILVQLHMFIDTIDGNLARNKNMLSERGKKLDYAADTLFDTIGKLAIGMALDTPVWLILAAIAVQQGYGVIATYYIVPDIRKRKDFKRTRIKQFFWDKGILFGMDTSMECLVISVLLLLPIRDYIFVVCPLLWIADLCYRLYELKWINRKKKREVDFNEEGIS